MALQLYGRVPYQWEDRFECTDSSSISTYKAFYHDRPGVRENWACRAVSPAARDAAAHTTYVTGAPSPPPGMAHV